MKITFVLFFIGVASAQRGSYGGSRPITGSRYTEQNAAAPEQSNFAPANQGAVNQDNSGNRFSGPSGIQPAVHYQNQPLYNQQPGFGGFGGGFQNNQGFQPFPFAPVPYRQ